MTFAQKISDSISMRLLEPADIDEFYGLIEREREWLSQWLSWPSRCDRQLAVDVLAACVELDPKQKGYPEVGIFHASESGKAELIGKVGHVDFNPRHMHCALGYWMAEGFAGKGIMTEAVRVLVDLTFRELGMHRVEILCQPSNVASRRIPEKLGFTEECLLKEVWRSPAGEFRDLVMYVMLEQEWKG